MCGCESWIIEKAEYWRIDAFELWCWGRLLRVPWTARRSTRSILKKIRPEYSLEGLMLKLKLQYFVTWCKEVTHLKRPWCWERLKAEGKDTGWDGLMTSPTFMAVNLSRLQELKREAWHAVGHGAAKSWTQLSDWTDMSYPFPMYIVFSMQRNTWMLWINWLGLSLGLLARLVQEGYVFSVGVNFFFCRVKLIIYHLEIGLIHKKHVNLYFGCLILKPLFLSFFFFF